MKSKVLKAFSIISFCSFFAGILFLFTALLFIDNDVISLVMGILFIFSPFTGITLAVIDLVKSRKNRKEGKKGGIMGLSIAAICLNFFTMIISICFSIVLISMAYKNLNYRWTHYIPKTEEKYRGFYISEEYFDAISNKGSYLKCFWEKNEKIALYEVRERTIAYHEDYFSYRDEELSKENAEKIEFIEENENKRMKAENYESYFKVSDHRDDFGESILKYYVPDADQILPGYSFVLKPYKYSYHVNADNTDFLIRRFDENDADNEEKIFAVKMNGNKPEIRQLERHVYDEIDEDGCGLPAVIYSER